MDCTITTISTGRIPIDAEVKNLVVEDKWIATVDDAVRDEIERITQQLAGRVQQLETRYAKPLPEMEKETSKLSDTVDEHLRMMGVA